MDKNNIPYDMQAATALVNNDAAWRDVIRAIVSNPILSNRPSLQITLIALYLQIQQFENLDQMCKIFCISKTAMSDRLRELRSLGYSTALGPWQNRKKHGNKVPDKLDIDRLMREFIPRKELWLNKKI